MINKTLIIDDEEDNLDILSYTLKKINHNIVSAKNGLEALEVLEAEEGINLIVLDLLMPKMNGIEFLKEIKRRNMAVDVPIIIQTASISKKFLNQGISLGAYYYLSKPFSSGKLQELAELAVAQYKIHQELFGSSNNTEETEELSQKNAKMLEQGLEFKFQSLEDVRNTSQCLANFFPDPERALYGISELMVNAVEHGNLGIEFNEKKELVLKGKWRNEILKRLNERENKDKFARVSLSKYKDKVEIKITDCGEGFEYNKYLELSKDRAENPSGRGIATAKIYSFDDLVFKGSGNEVVATVYKH